MSIKQCVMSEGRQKVSERSVAAPSPVHICLYFTIPISIACSFCVPSVSTQVIYCFLLLTCQHTPLCECNVCAPSFVFLCLLMPVFMLFAMIFLSAMCFPSLFMLFFFFSFLAVCSGRCCSVVACNTIREEEETPQSVQCAKCRHFHGDQPVSSHPNLPSPSLVADQNSSGNVDPAGQNLDIPGAIPSRPQSPEEDSPLLCPSHPTPPHIPRGTDATQAIINVQTKLQTDSESLPTVLPISESPPSVFPTSVPKCNLDQGKEDPTHSPIVPDEPNIRDVKKPDDSSQTLIELDESHTKDIELAVVASEDQGLFVLVESEATGPCGGREISETTFICKDIQDQIVKANQSQPPSQSPTQSCSSLQIQGKSSSPPEFPSQSPSSPLCPKKVSSVQESPVSPFSSGGKRPGSAQRIHSPSTPDTPTKPKIHTESPKGSSEDILSQSPLASPEEMSSPEDDPEVSTLSQQATKLLSDDEEMENINETSRLLDETTASTSRVSAREKPQFQKSLSVDSAKISARKRDSIDSVESASESLTALNLSPVKKKKKVTVPYRMAPDGTRVNFLCDVSRYLSTCLLSCLPVRTHTHSHRLAHTLTSFLLDVWCIHLLVVEMLLRIFITVL